MTLLGVLVNFPHTNFFAMQAAKLSLAFRALLKSFHLRGKVRNSNPNRWHNSQSAPNNKKHKRNGNAENSNQHMQNEWNINPPPRRIPGHTLVLYPAPSLGTAQHLAHFQGEEAETKEPAKKNSRIRSHQIAQSMKKRTK